MKSSKLTDDVNGGHLSVYVRYYHHEQEKEHFSSKTSNVLHRAANVESWVL